MKADNFDFLLAIITVLIIVFLSTATYLHLTPTNFFIGPLRFTHWLAIIGTIYIAVATPSFIFMKHFYPKKMMGLFRFHMFGNLLFFGLISIHFSTQVSRPDFVFLDSGMGLALYLAMALQVMTGFTQRFRFKSANFNLKTNRFLHASLIMPFYIIIILHALHGLGYL